MGDLTLRIHGRTGRTGKEVEQVMEIKRNNYILCSDKACCWIEESFVNKKGKPDRKVISGYYPNFRMLADVGLPSHVVRDSEAKSFKKLIEDVKKIEEKIARMTTAQIEGLVDDMNKPL